MRGLAILIFCLPHVFGYPETRLWFNTPAANFTDSVLLGNGRLGAAVWGDVANDRFALNEETLWAGGPYTPVNPGASPYIAQARDLLNQGKWTDAQNILANAMAIPLKMTQYQTAGSLLINMTQPELASNNGVNYTRTSFTSGPSNVLVVKLNATAPGSLNFTVSLRTPTETISLSVDSDGIVLNGKNTAAENGIAGVMTYQVRTQVHVAGGTSQAVATSGNTEGHILVEGADEIVIVLGVATSFVRYDDGSSGDPTARLAAVFDNLPTANLFESLLVDHIASHQKYFNRFTVDTGNVAEFSSLPTDARIHRGLSGGDPGIVSLYMNFARYLLISSSQPGSLQPANLQGIWQFGLTSNWQSKYTVNINIEQASVTGLSDTMEPLLLLLEDVAVTGQHTAQVMYNVSDKASTSAGAPPWVMHHNTDLWRATAPIDSAYYGFWPTGGASQFFLETLQPHPNNTNWLVTNPSLSPEKAHHSGVSTTLGPTMDNALLRDLFEATSALAKILDIDAEFSTTLAAASQRLPPFMITSAGALQEWIEDYEPKPPAFSHISPMYPLYPSAQIDPRINATLAKAAEVYLTYRGDGAFGWPVAWRIGTWARLLDGEHVYKEIQLLASDCCAWPSLMGKNTVFQIDANLGGGGAMVEMFMQSHNGEIHLLPAMPQILQSGSIQGVRARGGFSIDISWENGALKEATFAAVGEKRPSFAIVRLQGGSGTITIDVEPGAPKTVTAGDFP
ncbi:Six-hairpin glycosidase-like protein [Auriculariales sp. MPI-PUGE-AT-0066]|nr:Six-hairpin glycosidase-like protein [Auriculariales sp. MPI-PUGE-AT-0066]